MNYISSRIEKHHLSMKLVSSCMMMVFATLCVGRLYWIVDERALDYSISSLQANTLSPDDLKPTILANMDDVTASAMRYPFDTVINRGVVTDYHTTKRKHFDEIDDAYKTAFPQDIAAMMQEYADTSLYSIDTAGFDASLRQRLWFLKRLVTASRTSSYVCNASRCDRWREGTGRHRGVDMVTATGTPLYAIADGIVVKTQVGNTGLGTYIVVVSYIDGEFIAAFYGHLSQIEPYIQPGTYVRAGDRIAKTGNTGNSTAPHLDLSIMRLGDVETLRANSLTSLMYAIPAQYGTISIDTIQQKTYNPISYIALHLDGSSRHSAPTPPPVQPVQPSPVPADPIPTPSPAPTPQPEEPETHQQPAPEPVVVEKEEIPFRIESIVFDTDPQALLIGSQTKATIRTSGKDGTIVIGTSGERLAASKELISYNGSDEYIVDFVSDRVGEGVLVFEDASGRVYTYDYDITIKNHAYRPTEIETLGIVEQSGTHPLRLSVGWIKGDDPMDKVIDANLKLTIKDDDGETIRQEEKPSPQSTRVAFDVTEQLAPGNYTIYIKTSDEGKSFTAATELTVGGPFSDYGADQPGYDHVLALWEDGIVRGAGGKLLPQRTLTRAEMITLMMRAKYGDDVELFKNTTISVIREHGEPIFGDVPITERYTPYLYQAYNDGVLKGHDGNAMPDDDVTQADLLTMLGRQYSVEGSTDLLPAGEQDAYYAAYVAGAVTNEYAPYIDTQNFALSTKIRRIDAIESLWHYTTHHS